MPPAKESVIEEGPVKSASFKFDVSKIELSNLRQPLIELEHSGQDIRIRPSEVEAINDIWKQIAEDVSGSTYRIRKEKFLVYKIDSQLLADFQDALAQYKEGSGLEDNISSVLETIKLTFFQLSRNSYERISLGKDQEEGDLEGLAPISFDDHPDSLLVRLAKGAVASSPNLEDLSPDALTLLENINSQIDKLLKGAEEIP